MTQPLPEVRQNHNTDSHLYGAVAVAGAGVTEGMWGVMDPEQGGHWATAEEVADWATIQQGGVSLAEAEVEEKG